YLRPFGGIGRQSRLAHTAGAEQNCSLWGAARRRGAADRGPGGGGQEPPGPWPKGGRMRVAPGCRADALIRASDLAAGNKPPPASRGAPEGRVSKDGNTCECGHPSRRSARLAGVLGVRV